ncbi:MAG: TRAP transporter small permease [Pseudomonadota bacterium]
MWKLLEFLSFWSDKFCRILIALMMSAMVLDVLLGVVNRFVFKFSISWTEQLARFLLIWISMLGAATAVRLGAHIGVSFMLARLGRWRRLFLIINIVLVIGFLAVVGYFGVKLCLSQARQFSPVMHISMFWPFLAAPAGCFLMILHYGAALNNPGRVFDGGIGAEEGGE